ncbi:Smg-4/UPF3 family-domain-containing protein [Microdochium bolleyi]|uniref:Smg-4/UPF3 family-domain-containing protein n=1 Tax=Microdochium bolleyi TaxID=196109 RepID=A0A136JGU6_9PEZI|nr:Smg-4/UPF3 family-domain-containing protein [Microdochium bolleyi]
MTEEEFWTALGDDWKSGQGKVDWTRWESGKITKDPFKPSKPSRCYLRVLKLDDVPILSDIVRSKTWVDSKNTWNDACLVGPAYVEVAQIQKVAASKRRTDPRQGTIDQDPDFVAFLESLDKAQNASKEPKEPEEPVTEDTPKEAKVTITPLVQFLKEKKANKAKEAANAKNAKHGRQEPGGGRSKAQDEAAKKKGKDNRNDKSDGKEKEKAKEPVKLLTKKAAQQEAAEAAKTVAASKATAESKTTASREEPTPKSRRAGIAAAAKILQRDLGLSPGSAHRRARQDAAKAEVSTKSEPANATKDPKEPTSASTSVPAKPSASSPAAATSSRDLETQPSTPKSQANESNRRARGKGGKQNTSGADSAKGKEVASNTPKSTAAPPTPVILKREDNVKQAAPATPPPVSTAAPSASASQSTSSASGKGTSAKASKGSNQASQKKNNIPPGHAAAGSRGFIKHANPSQGITEASLKQAMEAFGTVTSVEIDKRKGFAYVDFGAQDSLAKAMAASPITVAQGTVQVLERKDNKKAAASSASSAPAASTSAPAPSPAAQQASVDKPTRNEKPAPEKATPEGQADRPKRGGRGRGRKGGGNSGNTGGGANVAPKNDSSGGKGPSTSAAASVGGSHSTG